MKKVSVRWNPEIKEDTLSKICCRFNLEYHPTINGIAEYEIAEEDWEVFIATMTYGHFSILKE